MNSKSMSRSLSKKKQRNKMQKLSRSKIDLYNQCPRCFWLDVVKGMKRPSGAPFTLNVAVDHLLKKEFDILRASGQSHQLMKDFGLDLVPFQHEKMDEWRSNFKGVQYDDEKLDMHIFGAVDDIWVDKDGVLYVVDYKATSKAGEVELGNEGFHLGYKRQMEVYQWLLRKNGFKVSDTGYFVYVNGRKDLDTFDGKLEFNMKIIDYTGSDSWIEPILLKIRECLDSTEIPTATDSCEYCAYTSARSNLE